MKIFEPLKLKKLELKNRMVVSAMVTHFCSPDGMATEKFIAYHEHKAKGGWGLIITEDYAITKTAGGFKNLPGLWEDAQIESHRKLTERVHAAGGTIAAQIYHAGRETSSAITGEQPVAPSAVREHGGITAVDIVPHGLWGIAQRGRDLLPGGAVQAAGGGLQPFLPCHGLHLQIDHGDAGQGRKLLRIQPEVFLRVLPIALFAERALVG